MIFAIAAQREYVEKIYYMRGYNRTSLYTEDQIIWLIVIIKITMHREAKNIIDICCLITASSHVMYEVKI